MIIIGSEKAPAKANAFALGFGVGLLKIEVVSKNQSAHETSGLSGLIGRVLECLVASLFAFTSQRAEELLGRCLERTWEKSV